MTFAIQDWTELRERYFLDRYALHGQAGELLEEKPDQMWRRIAGHLAMDEGELEEFYWALEDFRFVPAGRILSGAGAAQKVTYYNCFVIGVGIPGTPDGRDSRGGIVSTTQRMIEITARGGGVGVNWGTLRPAGSYIKGVNSHSSGAVAWMSGIDHMVDKIRQGGTRTAALMYCLPDWHPDALQFITHSFLRANHSVLVSDKFMEYAERDWIWPFCFPDTLDPDYDQLWDGDINRWAALGKPVRQHGEIRAREMWDIMAQSACQTGNPGCLWIDRAQSMSNTKYFERYTSTNPCGEQWLPDNGCCNLGALNLVAFWDPNTQDLNWPELRVATHQAVRMLDRIIDLSPDIDYVTGSLQRHVRRVGLGTMGLADLLILKGLRYGSPASLTWIHKIYAFIRDVAYWESTELARIFSPAPGYNEKFLDGEFVKQLPEEVIARIRRFGIRNLTLTNQAPTGTISLVAGVSSGIEPIFSSSYMVNDQATGQGSIQVVHPLFRNGKTENHVIANDVTPEEHIMVQATVQRYLDNAVSKTINMPRGTTWQDVSRAYGLAYSLGCKGITIYVDGSREGALFTHADEIDTVPADPLGFDAACATGVCSI
jgi:ribonucleoside-diphosphate reductase alpha chain